MARDEGDLWEQCSPWLTAFKKPEPQSYKDKEMNSSGNKNELGSLFFPPEPPDKKSVFPTLDFSLMTLSRTDSHNF